MLDPDRLDPELREALSHLLEQLRAGRLDGLPPVDPEALDPAALGAPAASWPIIRYLRTAPFLGAPGVVGAGLGHRERGGVVTDELCAVVLVREKLPPGRLGDRCLPREVRHDGATVGVDVQVAPEGFPGLLASRSRPDATARTSHNRSGGPLSLRRRRRPCATGTLTGVFDGRCLTAAHVALGFGFADFVGNLPASLLWLFESPSGNDLVSSADLQVGQQLYRLFSVSSNLPVLMPFPSPLMAAGVISLLYVDGALGRQAPEAIPPFLQAPAGGIVRPWGTVPYSYAGAAPTNLLPDRSTRWGGRIRSAKLAWPSMKVVKDGQTTGVTWGEIWMPFFQLYVPLPLGITSAIVVFDLVLMRLNLAPGDSGSAILERDSLHYVAMGNLGFPPQQPSFSAGNRTCPVRANDINAITIGTPSYLHEILLGADLS